MDKRTYIKQCGGFDIFLFDGNDNYLFIFKSDFYEKDWNEICARFNEDKSNDTIRINLNASNVISFYKGKKTD